MGKIRFRQSELADIPTLLSIENNCFPSDRISPRQMRYLLTQAKAATLVAVDDQQVVGYVTTLLPAPPRPARIYSLAVTPSHRGQKIASGLMANLMDILRARHCQRVRLEVRADDSNVLNIYKKQGFKILERLSGYYEDGEDALRMQMELDPAQ